jgi:hypothetical protein
MYASFSAMVSYKYSAFTCDQSPCSPLAALGASIDAARRRAARTARADRGLSLIPPRDRDRASASRAGDAGPEQLAVEWLRARSDHRAVARGGQTRGEVAARRIARRRSIDQPPTRARIVSGMLPNPDALCGGGGDRFLRASRRSGVAVAGFSPPRGSPDADPARAPRA